MFFRFTLNVHSCFGLIFANNMLLCLDFDFIRMLNDLQLSKEAMGSILYL